MVRFVALPARLRLWESVETAPVDVAGSRATVTQTVGLVLPDNVYPIRAGRVQVTVEIRPETAVQRGGKP